MNGEYYITFVLFTFYSGYSYIKYTNDKSKFKLYLNMLIGLLISGFIGCIYSHCNKIKNKKQKIKEMFKLEPKSCIKYKKNKQKKKVSFHPIVKVKFIENRYEIKQ